MARTKRKSNPNDPFQKQYPDTAAGARQALLDMSHFTLADLQGSSTYPDNQVAGVWMVEHLNSVIEPEAVASIVYLKGYKEPFGNVREMNDFETEYEDY